MKVFLLEDDPVYRYMISSDLKEMGYEVTIWEQINGASDKIMQGNFDLLLIDIILPEYISMPGDEKLAGGIQVLESLRDNNIEIPPTIFVSVLGYETNKERIDKLNLNRFLSKQDTEAGAKKINPYFQKPYNKAELQETIKEIQRILNKEEQ